MWPVCVWAPGKASALLSFWCVDLVAEQSFSRGQGKTSSPEVAGAELCPGVHLSGRMSNFQCWKSLPSVWQPERCFFSHKQMCTSVGESTEGGFLQEPVQAGFSSVFWEWSAFPVQEIWGFIVIFFLFSKTDLWNRSKQILWYLIGKENNGAPVARLAGPALNSQFSMALRAFTSPSRWWEVEESHWPATNPMEMLAQHFPPCLDLTYKLWWQQMLIINIRVITSVAATLLYTSLCP